MAIFFGHLFFGIVIYIFLNFEVVMFQYEVYSKLMNGVFLFEYGVFIR